MDDFRLADWTVHPSLGRITRAGETVHLQPRIMDVLVYLSQNAGHVLSKEEILDEVWPDEFVANSVLTRAVAVLRRALGDSAKSADYVETIPKRGYRLVAEVEEVAPAATLPGVANGSSWVNGPADNLARSCLLGADVRWYLQWGEREIPLQEGQYIIGRGQEAHVAIRERGISRAHARLLVTDDRVTVEDLGSKHGTEVRGRPIDGPVQVEDGDTIVIRFVHLVLRDIAAEKTR